MDTALSQALIKRAQRSDLMIAPSTWRDHEMDHATFIPLYFINEAYKEANVEPDYRVVRVGLSGLSSMKHIAYSVILFLMQLTKLIPVVYILQVAICPISLRPMGLMDLRLRGPN